MHVIYDILSALLDLQQLLAAQNDSLGNPMDLPRRLISCSLITALKIRFDVVLVSHPSTFLELIYRLLCVWMLQNRYLFPYVFMLMDNDIFDAVDIFFLIVGHTHASMDQYFSVLARQNFNCEFIGSPLSSLSVHEVYGCCRHAILHILYTLFRKSCCPFSNNAKR